LIPIVILPSILSGGVATLSDIMFLAKKHFDSKMRYPDESDPTVVEGALSAAGDLVTVTAKTGKDLYLARAQVSWFANTTTGFEADGLENKCELKMNGVIVETTNAAISFGTGEVGTATITYDFKTTGLFVLAGETIILDVAAIAAGVDVEGFIECWEEDTGATPVI